MADAEYWMYCEEEQKVAQPNKGQFVEDDKVTLYFKDHVVTYKVEFDRKTGKPLNPFWHRWRLCPPQYRMKLDLED